MAEFIRHALSGRVHVAVPAGDRDDAWWGRWYQRHPVYREVFPPDADAVWAAMQPTPCRCGLLAIRPSDGRYYSYTEVFDDDQLCIKCWRATPAEVRGELFDHGRPVNLDDPLETP